MSTESNSGVQMSLNGNLEIFPLEEVLRLLARSRKSGCLRVESSEVQGRIFLSNGTLSLATTANDVEFRNKLVSSGLVPDTAVRRIELSGAPISESLAEGVSSSEWADFVREESVEGLYRIRRTERGSFDFVVDLAARYPTGESFDSEVVLSEADRRALEWEDIETVLPRLDALVRMVPALDTEESVTLGPATWQILAALGGGSSTSQVASRLMWSEFRTAREMATLIRNGLVAVSEDTASELPSAPETPVLAAEPEQVVGEAPEQEPVDAEHEYHEESAPEDYPDEEAPAVAEHEFFEVDEHESEAETFEPQVDEEPAEEGSAVQTHAEEGGADEAAADEAQPVAPEAVESFWGAETAEEPERSEVVEASVESESESESESVESSEAEDAAEEEVAPTSWRDEATEQRQTEEPDSPWGSSRWSAEAPAEEAVIEATPWGSPVADTVDTGEPETDESPVASEEPVADVEDVVDEQETGAGVSGDSGRSEGWWAETMGAAEEQHADADNEADRFLESVFSSLSTGSDEEATEDVKAEDETGFGMGLLRRRRLGASARDVDDDR